MSTIPYLGSRISLISKNEIRYEGILYSIDTNESKVALQNGMLPLPDSPSETHSVFCFKFYFIWTLLASFNPNFPRLASPSAPAAPDDGRTPSCFYRSSSMATCFREP